MKGSAVQGNSSNTFSLSIFRSLTLRFQARTWHRNGVGGDDWWIPARRQQTSLSAAFNPVENLAWIIHMKDCYKANGFHKLNPFMSKWTLERNLESCDRHLLLTTQGSIMQITTKLSTQFHLQATTWDQPENSSDTNASCNKCTLNYVSSSLR